MKKMTKTLFSSLVLSLLLHTAATAHTLNQGHLINKHFLVSVPYYNTSDSAVLIDVVIHNKTYKFLLDTGAPLAISRQLQKELQFPSMLHGNVNDANGDSVSIDIVKAPLVEIGALQFKNIPALVLDLGSPLFNCIHFDGIVGSNMLRLLAVQFNKPEHKIVFADNIDSFRLPAGTVATTLFPNATQSDPRIVVKLNEVAQDTLLFDSGDQILYTISKYKFDMLNRDGIMSRQILAKGKGVNGQGLVAANTDTLSSFLLRANISISGQTIKGILTEPSYSQQSRMGRELFNYGLVTMDYVHRKFYFSPYKRDMTFNVNPSFGFKYGERNSKFVVTLVWDNTEAKICGLQPGDVINAFGSFIPAQIPICDWEEYCDREITKDTITISFKDKQGLTKTCMLKKLTF